MPELAECSCHCVEHRELDLYRGRVRLEEGRSELGPKLEAALPEPLRVDVKLSFVILTGKLGAPNRRFCDLLQRARGRKTEVFGRMLVFSRLIWTGVRVQRRLEHHWEVLERQWWCEGGQMLLMQPENRVKTAIFSLPAAR